ncbi:peptidyl-tRNA hydrolase domain-containingprotein [Purpureocillium lilacinum]|uniref:Peptidyl-tRNA hydrolase domain-containingprotein n=1 Tax=Purpureocillium lilacinum TaxID=33203 RepID=A0A179H7I2_PURLI|nr:peptidyl-tRNA hydrolase domain-containingprotein [Purpureocillium lilacinum]OAQ85550.1 peptidyl-tRNA hydrolase domain-containingprotein [Purpureocillium lilacinum]
MFRLASTSSIPRIIHPAPALTSPLFRPRPLSTTAFHLTKSLPSRPKPPPDSEIEESFLKGSGPGGQKINKTNSAVQLKHIPTGIVVKSQATRSRSQNRKHARELLAQRVDDLLHGDQSRSAIVGEVKRKRAASAAKKSRRKYRKLQDDEEPSNAQDAEEPSDHVRRQQNEPDTTTQAAESGSSSSTSTSKDKP